jgi:hypothetical protein
MFKRRKKETENNSVIIKLLLILILFTILLPRYSNIVSADTDSITLDETLEPIYFEEEEIPLGEELSVYAPLIEGKRYHILLIGEWLDFESPVTDYDITIFNPDGEKVREASESAGLPEQIANDAEGQFFIPDSSGTYTFVIKNDETNSAGAQSAIFLIIEHIHMNKSHRTFLQGRSPEVDTYETAVYRKAFEFNTSNTFFKIQVDVPESLEMYEARLYRMASPEKEIGLEIEGLGVPPSEFLEGDRSNGFGGFDYEHKSNITRVPELIASCNNYGQDMFITHGDEDNQTDAENVFYYLVLLAEFGQGDLVFYVKTEISTPVIELMEPRGDLIAEEENLLKVKIDSERKIKEAWVEYSDNHWRTSTRLELQESGGNHVAILPPFELGEVIDFKIGAKDSLGNVENIRESREVKKKVELELELSDSEITAGNSINIQGSISMDSAPIRLEFKNGDYEEVKRIQASSNGFSYSFKPQRLGSWSIQAIYPGTDEYAEVKTGKRDFTVNPIEVSLITNVVKDDAMKGGKIVLSGRTEPARSGVPLRIIYTNLDQESRYLTTGPSGDFNSTYIPREVGTFQILVEIEEDWRYGDVQSDPITVNIHPKTPIELMISILYKGITPPFLYLTGGVASIIIIIIIYRFWRNRSI